MSVVACDSHKRLAKQMALESIVLLQNKNNILPLDINAGDIVVMGPNANDSVMQWGNYNGTPTATSTIMQGISAINNKVKYVEGCGYTRNQASVESLLADVGDAKTVIFVGGISPSLEGEEMNVSEPGFKGGDRTDIELPNAQRDVIAKLNEAGKDVVFVNCSGSALALVPESKNAKAIIQAWYPGEKGGEAVADVLFGKYNPCGKLPLTFYGSTNDLPDFLDYRMENRTYRYFKGEPLFPFGFGLSYTSFKIGKPKIKNGNLLVDITNTGKCEGSEIVQLYVRKKSDVKGPKLTLKGFQRIGLSPCQKKTICFEIDDKVLETWDNQTNTMRALKGEYEFFVGTSSRMEDLKAIRFNAE